MTSYPRIAEARGHPLSWRVVGNLPRRVREKIVGDVNKRLLCNLIGMAQYVSEAARRLDSKWEQRFS